MSHAEMKAPIPAHVPRELVFDFDVYNPPGGEEDYHRAWKRLHEVGAPEIFWSPYHGGHWVPTRGEDIFQIFKDFEHFSSRQTTVPKRDKVPVLPPILTDPPDHTGYRAIIAGAFAPGPIAKLEADVRVLAIRLIEGMQAKGECDFVVDFAQHLPIGIFMSMVELPEKDRLHLMSFAEMMVYPDPDPAVQHEREMQALGGLGGYLEKVILERTDKPGTDLLSKIAASKINGRPLTMEEKRGLATLVCIGGLDTVASMMGFIAHFLATHPEHRRQLVEDPDLIPNACEEFIRRFPVANPGRMVRDDTVYKGVQFKAGDMIVLPTELHGIDDRQFEQPMEVDFKRDIQLHSTFGNGQHRCPGSYLARTEIKVFLQEWMPRIPDFRLKPGAKVGIRTGINGSFYRLPLEWDVH